MTVFLVTVFLVTVFVVTVFVVTIYALICILQIETNFRVFNTNPEMIHSPYN